MVGVTLYSAALPEKERLCVPLVGTSIDRRSLVHVGEVLKEDAIHVFMCFVCACKHIQHTGYNAFGDVTEKGTIKLHSSPNRLLESLFHGRGDKKMDVAFDYNLSYEFF